MLLTKAHAQGVGRKADKVQWPLEICSSIHSSGRANHLCLAVLHSAQDENNHLPHGQVQHTINFTVFFQGFINSMAEYREFKNRVDNPLTCGLCSIISQNTTAFDIFIPFFHLKWPKNPKSVLWAMHIYLEPFLRLKSRGAAANIAGWENELLVQEPR